VQIFGHRGSRATHAENTIGAFKHALDNGADGVELDVAAALDNVLVVTHDLVLKDGRVVREHRGAHLGLPTLEDVLAMEPREGFWFDIEAKTEPASAPDPREYAGLLQAAIRRSPARNVIVRSFDHQILRAFHEVEPEIPLAALIESSWGSEDWVKIARDAGAVFISPHFSTVTPERVSRAHAAGIGVSTWTVNQPADWARMAEMAVDTIITDDPAAAVTYFKYRFKSG
jgi:glycerophosphoryl diester phosphodiesterase